MARKLKQAKKDFEVADLPRNRWQVFGDVYKNRFSLIVNLGLIMFLFCLPSAALLMLTLVQSVETNQLFVKGEISADEMLIRLVQTQNASNVALIVALVILSIGLAGVCEVVKKLVWQEGILLKSDFWSGVKSNGASFAITALLGGVLNYLLQYFVSLGYFESSEQMQFALVACIVVAVLFCLTAPFVLVQTTLYNLGYFKKLSNAFLFAMRVFPKALLILILNVAPFLLLLVDDYVVHVFSLILLPIIAMPCLTIVNTLFVQSVLDEYVNKQHFPQIYKKGMSVDAQN